MKTIIELTQEIKNKFSEKKVIAPVESTSTASQAYAVGKKFFYNNILYRCTTAIAKNGSIVPGTNCTAADAVETQIDSIDTEVSNVKQALSNEVVTRATLGAKNRLPVTLASLKTRNTSGTWANNVYTINDVTFTVQLDADGSVTGIEVNGTASDSTTFNLGFSLSEGILSGCPSGGSWSKYVIYQTDGSADFGSGASGINTTKIIAIFIADGYTASNLMFYPMVRLATDSDTTYQPYAKTNKELTADTTGLISNEFANGAVNLLPNEATNQTLNGITFTVNADKSVTLNGTSTEAIYLVLYTMNSSEKNICKAGKRYKISGYNPADASLDWGYVYIAGTNAYSSYISLESEFDGWEYDSTKYVYLFVRAGKTLNNVIVKPMITLADQPNSDYAHYVPYAKSNKELTPKVGTVTTTTNSNGLIALPSLFKVIWANVGNLTNHPHTGLIIGSYTGVQTTFKVIDNTTGNAIANESVTITYLYLDF